MISFTKNLPDTILLVEDDPNDVLLIQRAFDKVDPDIRLEVVRDGAEAIAYLSRQGKYADLPKTIPFPSLIFLDLKLPGLSGLDVLTWIRQQAELKRLIVVVLTSSKETPDVKQAYNLGANSYILKPVTFENLVDLVNLVNQYWFTTNERPSYDWY